MRRIAAAVVAVVLVAAACGDDAPAVSTLPPDPAVILQRSADAMLAVQTLHFVMERSGAPIAISGLEFDRAEGEYVAPSSAKAVLDVKAAGITVQLGTIAIEERVWLTNPLTRGWDEFPDGTGFNPAIIFDPEQGWPRVLGDDLADAQLIESGNGTYTVRGSVNETRVEVLTAGLVADQAVEVDLVVDAETALLACVAFSTDGVDGQSDWVLEMSDFDEPVSVEPPADS